MSEKITTDLRECQHSPLISEYFPSLIHTHTHLPLISPHLFPLPHHVFLPLTFLFLSPHTFLPFHFPPLTFPFSSPIPFLSPLIFYPLMCSSSPSLIPHPFPLTLKSLRKPLLHPLLLPASFPLSSPHFPSLSSPVEGKKQRR